MLKFVSKGQVSGGVPVDRFWSVEAEYMSPFDGNHWVYIAVLAAVWFLLVRNKESVRDNRKGIDIAVLVISVLQQILLYTWYYFETGFHLSVSLPLHISRISTLLGMLYLLTKSGRLMDVLFYFSLFAYGSFLYPLRIYGVEHAMGMSFLLNHIITLLLPYYAYLAYGWKPSLRYRLYRRTLPPGPRIARHGRALPFPPLVIDTA